jgi:5S rRNA maturation endonuclease (ribonuclease M5)
MVDRAKDLLLDIVQQRDTDASGLIDEVRSVLTTSEVTTYKDTGMTCGPNVEGSDALIIVEGRNDVLNLAKCGIKNSIAVMGAGVDNALVDLVESKSSVTAFLDGDRGGKMIALELAGILEDKLTRIAFAPAGREVEHLEKKLVGKHLGQAEPAARAVGRIQAEDGGNGAAKKAVEIPDEVRAWAEQMPKARQAVFILEDGSVSDAIGASKLAEFAAENKGLQAIVINSPATDRVLEIASENGIASVVAKKINGKAPAGVEAYALSDLK